MAMTKKERAEFDAALKTARVLGALRWTEAINPDVPPPQNGQGLTTGYMTNAYSGKADVACSGSVYHARGRTDETTTQRAVWLYSTELLALKATRHEVEKQCAERLASIDEKIEALSVGKPT